MKVLVVSGHTLIGQSLITMLKSLPEDMLVEATYCDATRAVEHAHLRNADVVLVDATADFGGGLANVRVLAEALPQARIVMLGTEDDDASIYEVISAGAVGYLARETSPGTLADTLRAVQRGELGLSGTAVLRVVQQLRRAAQANAQGNRVEALSGLTQRETEIFDLVRRGMRSREIAERLCIAEATVYKHIQNVLDKLNVHSRTQAMLVAQREIALTP